MKKKITNYVCPKCFEQIKNCNCDFAPYNLIMIDEKVQYAVKKLNLKGHITGSCCESHFSGNGKLCRIYISFVHHNLNNIPVGWKINKDYLYYDFKPKSKIEFQETKDKAINELNNWIDRIG